MILLKKTDTFHEKQQKVLKNQGDQMQWMENAPKALKMPSDKMGTSGHPDQSDQIALMKNANLESKMAQNAWSPCKIMF